MVCDVALIERRHCPFCPPFRAFPFTNPLSAPQLCPGHRSSSRLACMFDTLGAMWWQVYLTFCLSILLPRTRFLHHGQPETGQRRGAAEAPFFAGRGLRGTAASFHDLQRVFNACSL